MHIAHELKCQKHQFLGVTGVARNFECEGPKLKKICDITSVT